VTDKRLSEVMTGTHGNYVFPFFWQRGNHTDAIPEQIERIYHAGCTEFCVESKSHPEFCRDGWWRDMDIILAEAKKRNMRVWILDDDRFPTGHAAGMIQEKYPHLRQWHLTERHIDLVGPAAELSVFVREPGCQEDIVLGAYAYRRIADADETCTYEAIDLTANIKGNFLYWNVPDGIWRIFIYFKSRRGGFRNYMDMISAESVRVLIDAVYETHYAHYSEYFGNTIAGFFSDEPAFANQAFRAPRVDYGFYEQRIGTQGLALPWNENVRAMMEAYLGFDPMPHLNLLWYSDAAKGGEQAEIRFAYMDAITRLYSECFDKQVGNWCRAHGVLHTGHVIEDMGSHSHLRHCPGHYFRSMAHQDMSGVDVVFQQLLPELEHYYYTSSAAQGVANGEFFHYVLAKMGASLAHLTPSMKGRAMCEVFGAYGWAADTALMKYIIDSMLVRGINHFVPHAFSTKFPDAEYPPHFSAEGHNPSYEGFGCLMKYASRAAHLLSDAVHIANAAILYDAEGEWASRYRETHSMHPIASRLYDAHIDYDIIPMDFLQNAEIRDGKMYIADEKFDCLIVSYADHLPAALQNLLKTLHERGFVVWFSEAMPENAIFAGNVIAPDEIVPTMRAMQMTDVTVDGEYPRLRIYHCRRDSHDIYMFANEDLHAAVSTTIRLPSRGEYAKLDLLGERYFGGETPDGALKLHLLPGQSQIVIFEDKAGFEEESPLPEGTEISPTFKLALASFENLSEYTDAGTFETFFNVTGGDFRPEFSGKMKYTFRFTVPAGAKRVWLDLGRVGQNAALTLNGTDLGIRIAPPYLYEITGAAIAGENRAEVIVSNTLAQKMQDPLSYQLPLAPSGLLGGMRLLWES